jgi:hypothetical protein
MDLSKWLLSLCIRPNILKANWLSIKEANLKILNEISNDYKSN